MVIDFNAPNAAGNSSRTGQTGATAVKRDAGAESARSADKAPEQKQPAAESSVKLSEQAQQLNAIEERLRQLPEVDSERVAQIRQAVADGSYKPDSSRIADKLLALESR